MSLSIILALGPITIISLGFLENLLIIYDTTSCCWSQGSGRRSSIFDSGSYFVLHRATHLRFLQDAPPMHCANIFDNKVFITYAKILFKFCTSLHAFFLLTDERSLKI